MLALAILGLVVTGAIVLLYWPAGPDDDDDSNNGSGGPGGGQRIPIRIPTNDRGPR
jgi:hypothetical protein